MHNLDEIIGSKLHGNDLQVGFDVYHKAQQSKVLPTSLHLKRNFQQCTAIQKLQRLIGS